MFKRILTYSILSLIALGGFFGNVDIDTHSINNISEITIQFTGNSTYAASGDTTSTATVTMYNNLISGLNIALAILSAMISPIVLLVGWLMSPDWTSGDLFNLRAPMYSLWVTVSNIVYFIYAILLILIALGTMFGQDKFSYKVMLPKLALGIIMVPFTWWFVQWTISIASVVTASVMTIPAETIAAGDSAWFNKPSIPKIIKIDNTGSGASIDKIDCSMYPTECQSPKDFLAKSGGMYGPLIVYGYSIFKFEKIDTLNNGLDIAKAALQIVHTTFISAIMFAVFGLLTLALGSMLLVRAMKLWMYAIFAPLFTFRFVAGSNLLGGDDDSFSIKEFIGLAFVPAIVGLTLSFGLIIINAVQGPGSNASITSSQECDLNPNGGKPCIIEGILGNPANSITRTIEEFGKPEAYTRTVFKYADIQFFFLGKASNQSDSKSTTSGAIGAVGGMFGTLIVDIIALVFIWMSFMAAKNVSKAISKAVEPFEQIGKQVGGLAKSIPKYTPLPIPGGSIHGTSRVVDAISHLPEKAAEKRVNESQVGRMFGLGEQASASDMKYVREHMSKADAFKTDTQESRDVISKLIANGGKYDSSETTKAFLEKLRDSKMTNVQMTDYLKRGGMDEENAVKIATHVLANHTDPKTNRELADVWKAVGTKGSTGGSTGGAGATGFTTTKAANDNMIFNFNGGPSIVLDKKVSIDMKASDIAKSINDHKDEFKEEHKIDKVSLEKMLTGSGRVDAKKIAEEIFKDLSDKIKKV